MRVYCVDMGKINWRYKVSKNNQRYKGCDLDLENLDYLAFTDLYLAIEKAKEYINEEHNHYAVVSIYETEVEGFELAVCQTKGCKEIALRLSGKEHANRVLWSAYKWCKETTIDFISGKSLINDNDTQFVKIKSLKRAFQKMLTK